jgi:hypothetical protein
MVGRAVTIQTSASGPTPRACISLSCSVSGDPTARRCGSESDGVCYSLPLRRSVICSPGESAEGLRYLDGHRVAEASARAVHALYAPKPTPFLIPPTAVAHQRPVKQRVAAQRWESSKDTHFPIINNSLYSISTISAQSKSLWISRWSPIEGTRRRVRLCPPVVHNEQSFCRDIVSLQAWSHPLGALRACATAVR